MRRLSIFLLGLAVTWTTLAIAANTKKQPPSTRLVTPRGTQSGSSDVVRRPSRPQAAPTTGVGEQNDDTTNLYTPEPETIGTPVFRQATPSGVAEPAAAVNMNWYSINNGGATEVAAGNIKMGVSVGQSAVGEVAAGNVKLGLGFWYGAGPGTGCACACHADPRCDSLPDIFDVTLVINVAFRDGAPILDPGGNCLYQTTDVDCSSATDILDVSKMINVAFRDGSKAVNFCNPCP